MRSLVLSVVMATAATLAQAQITTIPNLPPVTAPTVGDALTVVQPCVTSITGYCSRRLTVGQLLGLAPAQSVTSQIISSALGYTPVNPSSLGSAAYQGVGYFDAAGAGTSAVSSAKINGTALVPGGNVTLPTGINQLTGDVTTSAGSGATTLATVNSSPGTVGDGSHVAVPTVNAKGLVTGVTTAAITPTGIGAAATDLSNVSSPQAARASLNAASRTLGDVTNIASSLAITGADSRIQSFGNAPYNYLLSDTATTASGAEDSFIQGAFMQQTVGAGHSGERNGLWQRILITGANAVPDGHPHNYSAVTGETRLQKPLKVNGQPNAYGQIFGGNFIGAVESGASPNGEIALNVSGAEFNVQANAPVIVRTLIQTDATPSTYQGSVSDAIINLGGGNFKQGIRFNARDLVGGNQLSNYPLDTSVGQALVFEGSQTVRDVLNADQATVTGHAFTFEGGLADLFKNTSSGYNLALRGTQAAVKLGSNNSTGTPLIQFYSAGSSTPDSTIQASNGTAGTAGKGALTVTADQLITNGSLVRPGTDGQTSLGNSGTRFLAVYAQNGTIQTSDARKKEAVAVNLPRLAAALKATPTRAYVWKDGSDKSRIRFGVYAQELAWALYRQGLNWQAFSFLQYDKASDSWGVNYVELQNAKDMLAEAGLLTVH